MARWLLDANVVIYLLTEDERYAERLKALIRRSQQEGHAFCLTPAVVAEVLYVLEGEYFGYPPDRAGRLIEQFILAPEVDCEDREFVLAGLVYHRVNDLDFVDGYLAARATEDGTALVTNDNDIKKHTSAELVSW